MKSIRAGSVSIYSEISCGGFNYKYERTGMGTVLVPLQYRSYRSFITKGTLLEQRHAAHTPLHCAG